MIVARFVRDFLCALHDVLWAAPHSDEMPGYVSAWWDIIIVGIGIIAISALACATIYAKAS